MNKEENKAIEMAFEAARAAYILAREAYEAASKEGAAK